MWENLEFWPPRPGSCQRAGGAAPPGGHTMSRATSGTWPEQHVWSLEQELECCSGVVGGLWDGTVRRKVCFGRPRGGRRHGWRLQEGDRERESCFATAQGRPGGVAGGLWKGKVRGEVVFGLAHHAGGTIKS